VTLDRMPLAALPVTLPGTKLGGVVSQGELVLAVDGDKLTVRSPAAFKLTEVSLAEQRQPALTGLSIEGPAGV